MRWKKGEVSVLLSHFTSPYIQQKYSYLSCVTSWLPGAIMGPGPFPSPPVQLLHWDHTCSSTKLEALKVFSGPMGYICQKRNAIALLLEGTEQSHSSSPAASRSDWGQHHFCVLLRRYNAVMGGVNQEASGRRRKSCQEEADLPPMGTSENTHLLSWGSIKALKEGSFSQGLHTTGHDSF